MEPSSSKDQANQNQEPEKDELDIETEESKFDPSLLLSLKYICTYYGKNNNEEVITAGLPIDNKRMTIDQFERASSQIGFETSIIRKKIKHITEIACPSILILNDGKAAVLKKIDQDTKVASVIYPDQGLDIINKDFKELESSYYGCIILIKEKHKFDERETKTAHTHKGHWFWSALAVSKPLYQSVLITSILTNFLAIITPIFVMNVYDRVVPNNAFETLWVLATGVLIAFAFDFFIKWMRFYALTKAGKKADIILSSRIMSQVLGLDMTSKPKSVGTFSRSMQDFESIRDFITSTTIASLIDLPCATIILTIIFLLGGKLVIVPIISMLIIVFYSLSVQPALKNSVEKTVKSSAGKNATLIETLIGLETIQVYGAESKVQHEWEKHIGYLSKWGGKGKLLTQSTSMVTAFVQQCNTVALISTGVYLISEQAISMGALIACNMLAGRSMAPIGQVVSLITRFHQSKAALDGLENIMAMPKRRNPEKNYVHLNNIEGNLQLDKVIFTYPDQKINALEDVSLKISAGEKVGIIGRIGSGKSTLGKILLGIYPPTEGLIRLDGLDITNIDPIVIRKTIGCIPQDINLFFGSVRENITFGMHRLDDDLIIKAAKMSGVTDFTNLHPDGMDMQVTERGGNLSGGQRQAISIARALVHSPSIMIFDEPTSSMDNKTEQHVKEQFKIYCEDKTLILVTHKTSMLDLVDRLIIVDKGRIVADGPKEQVIKALSHGKIVVS